MISYLFLFLCIFNVSNCIHINGNTFSSLLRQEQVSCSSGDKQIPQVFLCDGISDCESGSDESTATCLGASFDQFNEENYMINPKGYKLPDRVRYKAYWDKYEPKLADLPYAGKSTASVEVYYLQAPAFNGNSLSPLKSWLVQKTAKSLNIMHAGTGLLFRDEKGRELSRVSIEYWSSAIGLQDNPNLLPSNSSGTYNVPPTNESGTLVYDEAGRLLMAGRAIVTYARSRGSWRDGYWTEVLHLKTLGVEGYHKKLPWINKYLVDHQQFTWMGLQDRQGNVLMPKMDCDRFARDMIQEFTGVDVMYLKSDDVRYMIPFVEVDVIEHNVDPRRVTELLDGDNFNRLASGNDLGGFGALFHASRAGLCDGTTYFGPFRGLLDGTPFNYCSGDGLFPLNTWKVDPKAFLLSPVTYNADFSPINVEEFVSRVDILHPTGRFVIKEVSLGLQAQWHSLLHAVICLPILLFLFCVFKRKPKTS